MSLGSDQSYQSKFYVKQQPDGQTFNGAAVITEVVADAGSLVQHLGQEAYGGIVEPALAQFTIAQGGSSGQCQITIQITDGAGNPIANAPIDLDVILSDNANGVGLTANTVTFAVTTGTILQTYTANKAFYVQANASGQIVVLITDASKHSMTVAVVGLPVSQVTRQLQTSDYHV